MTERAAGPLLVVVGPTAVGKSAAAAAAARALGAEVVSADSACVYRGLDVGSDKPDAALRRQVPHHLLDLAPPTRTVTLADWLWAARRALGAIRRAGRLPVVVGGTGLYVRALLEGYGLAGPAPPPRLRARLSRLVARLGPERLHALAARRHPAHLSRVDPHDARRIVRALERAWLGQPPPRATPYVPPPGVVVAELERPRPELYRRVDLRATRQWSDGRMLQEARRALDLGADPAGPALWALGYRQAVAVLRGRLTPDEAVRLTARDTRHLAKRQLAYWRAAPWLVHVPAEDAVAQLCRLGEAALAGMSAGAQGRGDDDAEDLHANR